MDIIERLRLAIRVLSRHDPTQPTEERVNRATCARILQHAVSRFESGAWDMTRVEGEVDALMASITEPIWN